MSDLMRDILLILVIFCGFALVSTIDRRADELEAAIEHSIIESRADNIAGLESLRMVELPLEPDTR